MDSPESVIQRFRSSAAAEAVFRGGLRWVDFSKTKLPVSEFQSLLFLSVFDISHLRTQYCISLLRHKSHRPAFAFKLKWRQSSCAWSQAQVCVRACCRSDGSSLWRTVQAPHKHQSMNCP